MTVRAVTKSMRHISVCALALLIAACVGAAVSTRSADWAPFEVFVLLLGIAVISDAFPLDFRSIRISGSFLAIVLAAALLGPAPAAAIGIATVLADAARTRVSRFGLIVNLAIYSSFPLVGGLVFRLLDLETNTADGVYFALGVLALFMALNLVNFLMVAQAVNAGRGRDDGDRRDVRSAYLPLLPAEFATGLLTAAVAYAYVRTGTVVLGAARRRRPRLPAPPQHDVRVRRARRAARAARPASSRRCRSALISTVLQTLSLRDRMTARHSAAVARYAREMAARARARRARAGRHPHRRPAARHRQVHLPRLDPASPTASSTDEDSRSIRRHPEQGAKLVERIEGYGPVAEIIRAHHERIDGTGYPRGLSGAEIPLGVADHLDRRHLRRHDVARLLPRAGLVRGGHRGAAPRRGHPARRRARRDLHRLVERAAIAFRHADDADFEAELSLRPPGPRLRRSRSAARSIHWTPRLDTADPCGAGGR